MKIQVASDLHLDALARRFPEYLPVTHTDSDVLVLAGDIHAGTNAIDTFANWPVPVVYVHGNHEAYGQQYAALPRLLSQRAAATQVRYLEKNEWIVGDVRFLGACLWTDYALYGDPLESMKMASACMSDHTLIMAAEKEHFSPEHALAEHQNTVTWLIERLAAPFNGKTVVVTHHGVAPASIHRRFDGNPINAGFVSDLRHIVELADIWIHGHVHDSFDYRVGRARVIANPRGYATHLHSADSPTNLLWENPSYDPQLVITL
jgi:predicted phosphodiesterase